MKIRLVSFTLKGAILTKSIEDSLAFNGEEARGYTLEKFAGESGLSPLENGLSSWTRNNFETSDALVFIGACGIAVRSIAPYIKSKQTDPAVIVVDEKGDYIISLLSGHIGGANDLALIVANITGGSAVISTATDINGKFSVDSFAVKNNLHISDMKIAKDISAHVLSEGKVGISSDFTIYTGLPDDITLNDVETIGISISLDDKKKPYKKTLSLIPRIVSLGIGCRKGVPLENIEGLILKTLKENNISILSVRNLCSINIKENEQGIIDFCRKYSIEFVTFTPEELLEAPGEFTSSSFVKSITGVDNVCERAAVIGSDCGELVVRKQSENATTIAVAVRKWGVYFED